MTVNIVLLLIWLILLFTWVHSLIVDKDNSAIVWIIISILWIIAETFCIISYLIPLS